MARTAAIWFFGLIASGLAAAIVATAVMPAETYDGKSFAFIFGLVASVCGFACIRLWITAPPHQSSGERR